MEEIEVSIDGTSLNCKINLVNLHNNLRSELRFSLMSRWQTIEFNPNSIELPFYQFKRSLQSIGRWCKSHEVLIKFDELTLQLVTLFARDRRGFKGEKSHFPTSFLGIQENLDQLLFKRTLTQKQKEDVTKLLQLFHGANFSVPGAGKTTSLLAIHSILKSLGTVNKLLVICPINAFISWDTEVQEIFEDRVKIHRLTKSEIENFSPDGLPEADFYLANYEKFRNGLDGLIPIFLANAFHLVLDESHRMKGGFGNQSFGQIIQLGDCAKRRDIMSGTPMPQAHSDIESQFEFLWPTESILPKNMLGDHVSENIHDRIKEFFVRTTKNDLELEPVNYTLTKVEMGPIQKELFNLLRSESARTLASMERQHLQTFRFLGRCVVRLMQASTNPMLLTSNEDIYDAVEGIPEDSEVWHLLNEYSRYEKPAKFERLKERVNKVLETNSDSKVLIWSIFVKNILILEQMFGHYNPAIIYGGVSSSADETIEESREGQIRKFHNDPSCRIMIANPQACGEGISLHRVCHHAIYLERNYNAAHYLQSMDRIHRFGLKPGTETTIELLIANDSLDQKIDQKLREKIAEMSKVLDDKFLETMAYDPYDLTNDSISGLDPSDMEDIRSYIENSDD